MARTVYLQAPPRAPEPGSATLRLGIAFFGSFGVTTFAVLGSWLWLRSQRPPPAPPPAPEVRIVEVEKQVPVPIPVPMPVEVPAPPAPAVAPVAAVERPRPKPALKPGPKPAPKPAPKPEPAPEPAPPPVPAPVAEAPRPVPSPPPAPPAPPPVPSEIRALGGTYAGKGAGETLRLELSFGPDGKLSGKAFRNGAAVDATGTYEVAGSAVSFVLLERSGEHRVAYSGSIGATGAAGRMTTAGTDIGKFSVVK